MGSAFFDLEDRPQNTGQALRAFPYHNLHLGTSLSPALGRGCGRTRTPLHYYIQNRGKMLPARRLLSREHQIDHARGKPERCRFGGELVAHADGERMCERIIVQRIFQPLQRNTRRLLPGAENGEIPPRPRLDAVCARQKGGHLIVRIRQCRTHSVFCQKHQRLQVGQRMVQPRASGAGGGFPLPRPLCGPDAGRNTVFAPASGRGALS